MCYMVQGSAHLQPAVMDMRTPASVQQGHQITQQPQAGTYLGYPVATRGAPGQPHAAAQSPRAAPPRALPGPQLRMEFAIDLPMPPKQWTRRSVLDYNPALKTPAAPRAPGLPVAGRAAPTVVRTPPLPVAGVLYISRLPSMVSKAMADTSSDVYARRVPTALHRSAGVDAPSAPPQAPTPTLTIPQPGGPAVTIPAPVGPLRTGGIARSPQPQVGDDPDVGKPAVKTCKRCGETKARIDFSRETGQTDGLSIWCRICWTVYRSERKVSAFLIPKMKGSTGRKVPS
jgi:hypothetical protein